MEGARIEVGPVFSTLRTSSDAITQAVQETLMVDVPGAEHVRAFKAGKWDGKQSFFRRPNNQFLTGLVWKVVKACVAAGLDKPEVRWPLILEKPPLASELVGTEFRDYQQTTIERAIRMRRMAIQCPTGGGKTEMGMDIIRRLGRPALWLTHRKALRDQTAERFKLTMPGANLDQVFIGMVQTLYKVLHSDKEFFKQFEVLVMDEAHHAAADTWQEIAKACENAHYRYGLSGTMDTGNIVSNMFIEGATGPTWNVASTIELAQRKFLATPLIRILRPAASSYPTYEQVREKAAPQWRVNPRMLQKMSGKLFREMYEWGISLNEARNQLVLETAMKHVSAGEKFLVLCNRVPHAIGLSVYLERRLPGYPIMGLSGQTPEQDRVAILARYKAVPGGACLIATPFFREGMNLPEIDAGFLAGGGESDIAILQALGRMLRPRPDKSEVLIYDVHDGRDDPNDKRRDKDWLANNFYGRLKLYTEQGFAIERSKTN